MRHTMRHTMRHPLVTSLALLPALFAPEAAASGGEPLDASAVQTLAGAQADGFFGSALAGAGDVDGDGYDDLLIGAYGFDGAAADGGATFLHPGTATGVAAAAAWQVEGASAGMRLGRAVAGAGDVNGDGFDDVLVGAEGWDGAYPNEGRALLYLGSPAGLAASAGWSASGGQADAAFGNALAGAGDVNGDGYDDVLVGAELFDGALANEGAVLLYLGSPAGLAPTPDWVATGGLAGALFGHAVAGAGDVDGDGYDDVLVGSNRFDDGTGPEGAAFLFRGGASGLEPAPAWTGRALLAGSLYADTVAAAGDVNGDGFGDVLVTAPFSDVPLTGAGALHVYYGAPGGPAAMPDWSASGDRWGYLGYSAAGAGDLDGDGYDDLIAGAAYYRDTAFNEGAVFVFPGSASGPGASTFRDTGGRAWTYLGEAAAPAGDLDGDGAPDVAVAALEIDDAIPLGGGVLVYPGVSSAAPPAACADGADNDGDGQTDYPADPGCRGPDSDDESPQCDDGRDNDGDGRVDMADGACRAAWDDLERASAGCGMGFELALVLAAAALRRRGRARGAAPARHGHPGPACR